jgi:hypothetical protein
LAMSFIRSNEVKHQGASPKLTPLRCGCIRAT